MQRNVLKDITNSTGHLSNMVNANMKRLRSFGEDSDSTISVPAFKKEKLCTDTNINYINIKKNEKLKSSVNIISSWYLEISRRNKMKKYSSAVKIIERYRYGKKIKRLYKRALKKQQYLIMQACVINIQQWYRYFRERKRRLEDIKQFLIFQNSIIHFQACFRGWIVRKSNPINKSHIIDSNQQDITPCKTPIEISNITVDPLLGISRLSLSLQQIYNNNNKVVITPLSTPTPEMMRQFDELKVDEEDDNENENEEHNEENDNEEINEIENEFNNKYNSYYNSPTLLQSTHADILINENNDTINTRSSSVWDEVIDKAIDSNEGIINKSKRICWKYDLYNFILYYIIRINDDEEKERHEPNVDAISKPIYHSPSPQTKRTLESQLKLLINQEKRVFINYCFKNIL